MKIEKVHGLIALVGMISISIGVFLFSIALGFIVSGVFLVSLAWAAGEDLKRSRRAALQPKDCYRNELRS